MLLSCPHKLSLAVAAGCARNANIRIGKYDWKLEQILVQILAAANVQIGGARQAAVTSQPLHVCKVPQLKTGSLYPHLSNNCTLSWVRAILKAQECCEVKLSCFKGIGNPTDIHGSWGTWLRITEIPWTPFSWKPPSAQCENVFQRHFAILPRLRCSYASLHCNPPNRSF